MEEKSWLCFLSNTTWLLRLGQKYCASYMGQFPQDRENGHFEPKFHSLLTLIYRPMPKTASPSKKIQYLVGIIWNSAFLRVVPNGSPLAWSQISNEEPLGT